MWLTGVLRLEQNICSDIINYFSNEPRVCEAVSAMAVVAGRRTELIVLNRTLGLPEFLVRYLALSALMVR